MHYYNRLRIVFLIAVSVKWVFSECITPDGRVGECKMATDCKTILFLKFTNKTTQQTQYLRESGCGTFQGKIAEICCPLSELLKECDTSSGVKGVCTEVMNCTALHSLTLIETLIYFTSSCNTCNGTDNRSIGICCPTSTPSPPTHPTPPTLPLVQPTPTPTSTATSTSTSTSTSTPPSTSTTACSSNGDSSGRCQAATLPPGPDSGCCGCGIEVSSPKLAGGSETAIDQYPWLVLLEYRDIYFFDAIYTQCGGSLVSGRYVLTAAHCVDQNITNLPESVRLGEHNIGKDIDCDVEDEKKCNTGPVSIPIEKITKHILYLSPYIGNDIALLRLNRTVTFSDFIRPICLPSPIERDLGNLYVAGWGATVNVDASPVKMHAMVPFVRLTECHLKYPNLALRYDQICAGGEVGKDSCKSDSGGPLMHYTGTHYEVLGIVSYGKRPCNLGTPVVYTNVAKYLEWICLNMRE